jgi:voltage-gated potassium channel
MTVTTLTTVGYGEVHPLSTGGKVFAVTLMLVGVGVVAFALSTTVQLVLQAELLETFGVRRRYRVMGKLTNHFIICGAGRVGSHIIRDIERANEQFVVVEKDSHKVAALIERGVQYVIDGDATLEAVLKSAAVQRAKALVACLPDDAENLYTVLVARDLNPGLHIVARAVEEDAHTRLLRAGANRVVAPTLIGGRRMALAMLKPAVGDFLDSLGTEELDLEAGQVEVKPSSSLVGKALKSTDIRSQLNVVIVSIKRRDGSILFNPTAETTVEAGDTLIVIGAEESLAQLEIRASGSSERAPKGALINS